MTRYRKLPGTRRGFFFGSSVWIADDHLLLVKSTRFREEYKRFHLRDIQAIAVAGAPRFHISTRAVMFGVLWLAAWRAAVLLAPFPAIRGGVIIDAPSVDPYFWGLLAVLVCAWIYISSALSCRCRIYTAVSSDELPSVYRSWTARKFLAAVEPQIAAVQGVIEGEWAEAAESRDIGPRLPDRAPVFHGPSGQAAVETAEPAGSVAPVVRRSHTRLSDLLVAALFASGVVSFLMLRASPATARWPAIAFMLLKVGLAMGVFVQHYNGTLQSGMQRVAIAALLAMGGMYYLQQLAAGFQAGNRQAVAQVMPVLASGNRLASELDGGASLVLAGVGLGVVLLAKDSEAS